VTIGKPPACATCRTLHHREIAADECEKQLEADVSLLNSVRAHVVGHGQNAGLTRETIHALAALARAFLAMKSTPADRWRDRSR
jgi:hypothetical protein